MSSYSPPNSNYSIYNGANFNYATESITLETADSRYLKLTGGIELGSVSFSAGLQSASSIIGKYISLNPWTTPSFTFTGYTNSGLYYITDGTSYGNVGISNAGKFVVSFGHLIPSNAAFASYYNYDETYLGGFYCTSSTGAGVFRISSATNFASLSYAGASNVNLALPTTSSSFVSTIGSFPTFSGMGISLQFTVIDDILKSFIKIILFPLYMHLSDISILIS